MDNSINIFKPQEPKPIGFTIYSKSGCPNCTRIKKILTENNETFVEINCDEYLIEDKESFLDHHPTPKQHLKYVEDIILPSLSQPLIISNDTKLWAQDWDDRIHNAKPYFKCSVDGWSLDYRYKKYQGHLC
jgi:glutaredoxin